MREVELKFALHGPFAPSSFLESSSADVAQVVELEPLELRATYYDTEDLRLARSGVTLRYRLGDTTGWTVKLPTGAHDGIATRDEITFDGAPGRIPKAAADLVTAYCRTAPLRAVTSLHTKRRRWSLKTTEGREVAELADDEVSILDGSRVVARFRELEIEGRDGAAADLRRIGKALRGAGAVAAEPIPKAVRALGPRATGPPDVPPPRSPSPSEPAKYAVQSALANGVARMIASDPAARLGDVEGVHQMRVAARRLRSDLRTFAPLVDDAWRRTLSDELRWLARLLGAVRDLDVLKERLRASSEDIDGALDPLMSSLDDRHSAAHAALSAALSSLRFRELVDRLIDASHNPVTTPAAERQCRVVLVPLVAARWRSLRRAVRRSGQNASLEQLHRIRIRAKRARYAAEAVEPFLGRKVARDAARFGRGAALIQDVLGSHQDAIVATKEIDSFAATRFSDGAFNLAAGRLFERQSAQARRERSKFRRKWGRLNTTKKTLWLKS